MRLLSPASLGLTAILFLSPVLAQTESDEASSAPPVPGTVLLADEFDDPVRGRLPRASPDETLYHFGYQDGEYASQRVSMDGTRYATVLLPGTYSNTTIAVDVRLVGDTNQRVVSLECRRQRGVDEQQYRLEMQTTPGSFRLLRFQSATETDLVPWTASDAIRGGNASNRIELTCTGDTLRARINGTQAAEVQDGALQEGSLAISAGVLDRRLLSDGRFDNLVVTAE
jgi:hypothetical protein